MTYKVDPYIGKINSSLVLIFPNGERKEFKNGAEACSVVYDSRYGIKSVCAVENVIEVSLEELKGPEVEPGDDVTFN